MRVTHSEHSNNALARIWDGDGLQSSKEEINDETYKAAQVREPGKAELVNYRFVSQVGTGAPPRSKHAVYVIPAPQRWRGQFPSLTLPRVAGPRGRGRIDAVA